VGGDGYVHFQRVSQLRSIIVNERCLENESRFGLVRNVNDGLKIGSFPHF
jgi:hypothetical protein